MYRTIPSLISLCLLLFGPSLSAQKYITKNGHIKFFSEAPMETIEAHNRQVNCALDISNGDFVFKVLIKSFEFEKALMQEHFNENYMESDKIPASTFSGKIENISEIDFNKDGEYPVRVMGTINVHGVKKDIEEGGNLEVKGDKVLATSVFHLKPEDFDIKIPKTVIDNIAKEIEVTVDVDLSKMK